MSTINALKREDFPPRLLEIPHPPEKLYYRGNVNLLNNPEQKYLCVVGARKHTSYGKTACEMLIQGLSGYPITIISGLALGIDALAHEAAMRSGLPTIVVPGSGLSDSALYPRTNFHLAERILESGGLLLSEFEPDFRATVWSFPQRNRIMTGLSHGVLVIEAEERSGSLITARMAGDYNRELMVVPGPITSPLSSGPHLFMRIGATPVRHSGDILEALGIDSGKKESPVKQENLSPEESRLLEALYEAKTKDNLAEELSMPITTVSAMISLLELRGLVREQDGLIVTTYQ
ncbi:MAG: DNA-processing protein DprA [Patescibacteria group bacterium]